VPKGAVFASVPLETATLYAAEDADYALRAKALLEPCLEKADAVSLFRNVEMPLLPILAEMEGVGIKLEGNQLREYGIELGKGLERIEAEIYRLVGHPFNIASTKQLQEVLFDERKLKTGKKTKTGYSTDSASGGARQGGPVPAQILRFRTLSKLKSTYVDALAGLADENGRLRTHFVQTGTATGRLSSKDPNLQNIPIATRRPADQIGLRLRTRTDVFLGGLQPDRAVVLAHLSATRIFWCLQGRVDVHRRTAALIFSLTEDQVRLTSAESPRRSTSA
jgi:DNA polymerase-1